MTVTHDEVKRLFGEVADEVAVEIIGSGATLAELAEVAAHLARETDVMGELERPLGARARRIYTLLRQDEEGWEADR